MTNKTVVISQFPKRWTWAQWNPLNSSTIQKLLQSTSRLQTCCFCSGEPSSAAWYTSYINTFWPCCQDRSEELPAVQCSGQESWIWSPKTGQVFVFSLPQREKFSFHWLPSFIYGSSLFKTKFSCAADALSSPEINCWRRARRTNLTVLYMVV